MFCYSKLSSRWLLTVLLAAGLTCETFGQTVVYEPGLQPSPIASLEITPAEASQLQAALSARDYPTTEQLLLTMIDRDPHTPHTARLLAYLGSVYFLDQDYLNAAIAWKKSEAIVPLDPELRFSLAMAYVRIGHRGWARSELLTLAAEQPGNALYPYWLGRLDYDNQHYNEAIAHFQHAVELAPDMARAYNNLGLCYFYENNNALAISSYKKAIALDHNSPRPSAWPYLNLGIALQFLNQLNEAQTNLRAAIRLDPELAQAHFQMGNVLDGLGHPMDAVSEFRESARLDSNYPEPHFALARIYHKLGRESAAKEEVQTYRRLRSEAHSSVNPQTH